MKHAFRVNSPLLQGIKQAQRVTCYMDLAPYWAVPTAASSAANMIVESMIFEVPGFVASAAFKFPALAKNTKFSFETPIMRNTAAVKQTDLLCLKFLSDE